MTECGKNGLKEGDYFLLLKNKETISLNTFENNEIKEKNIFPISKKSIFATDQKERVAIFEAAKKLITLYDFQTSKETKLSIPYNIKPQCILLNDDNLFVGGIMEKEMLVQYHIQSEKWYKLEIPEEVSLEGKAVDDFVINDSFLIAIDNLIIPKYLLFYHLNSTGKLIFSHIKEMETTSYEDFHQGRITSKYLGLYSDSMNHGNYFEHITIYADLKLEKSLTITAKWFSLSDFYRKENNFIDFLIIDNKLFIANREKGLGIFEIKRSHFQRETWISENKVNYILYKNEKIIQLTKVPNQDKIILAIKNMRGKIRYETKDV